KGCNNISDTIKITTIASPEIKFSTKDTILCEGQSVDLASHNLFNKNYDFSWLDKDGVIMSTDSVFQANSAGVYYLSVTNDRQECTSLDSVLIKTTSSPTVPNINYNVNNCSGDDITLKACS